jgi:hypothetical protein
MANIIRRRPNRLNAKLVLCQEILSIIRGSDVQCRAQLRLINWSRKLIYADSTCLKCHELRTKNGFLPFVRRTDLIIQAGRLKLIPM